MLELFDVNVKPENWCIPKFNNTLKVDDNVTVEIGLYKEEDNSLTLQIFANDDIVLCKTVKGEVEKKKYNVVIHYEGAYDYTVEAETEEEAKEIANGLFVDADPLEVWNNVDWDVCDCWEEN